jgi:hypothetical protein
VVPVLTKHPLEALYVLHVQLDNTKQRLVPLLALLVCLDLWLFQPVSLSVQHVLQAHLQHLQVAVFATHVNWDTIKTVQQLQPVLHVPSAKSVLS